MTTGTMRITLGLLAGTLAAGAALAQQNQTAEGAQRFLAALVKKGNGHAWLVDAQGRTNHVRGKAVITTVEVGLLSEESRKIERASEKQLSSFIVSELDTQDPDGNVNACITRIAQWRPRESLVSTTNWTSTDEGVFIDTDYRHTQVLTFELSPELSSPQWIDWRNVKLTRSTNGAQMQVAFTAKQHTVNLAFHGETDLVDRVEYAMKFLKMSCDDTASTGF